CNNKCLTAETEVLTADGSRRPIGLLPPGDLVIGRDERTGLTSPCPVAQIFRHQVEELLILTLDTGEQINTTPAHPFALPNGQFIAAGELHPGTPLAGHDKTTTLHTLHPATGHHQVHNLEVANHHTYFIGPQDTWVHNKGAGECRRNPGASCSV